MFDTSVSHDHGIAQFSFCPNLCINILPMLTRHKPCLIPALMMAFALGALNPVWSQSISRDVTAAAGDYQQHPDFGSLHWTLGEPAVETLIQSPLRLSQGFHQLYILVVALDDPEQAAFHLSLFPNPTAAIVNVETTYNGLLQVEITDIAGKRLQRHSLTGPTTSAFDLSGQPAGTYLLRVVDEHGKARSFKVLKVMP